MNCPGANDWELLATGVLEGDQVDSMMAHARVCQTCRSAFAAARRDHVLLMRMYEALDRDHDDLREQLMAALPDGLPGQHGPGPALHVRRRLGDYLMALNTKNTRRVAAVLLPAACLVIAVAIFLVPVQKSAFAAAIEHLKQAKTIVCRVTTTVKFEMQPEAEAEWSDGQTSKQQAANQPQTTTWYQKLYMSAEDGTRRDTLEGGAVVRTTYTPVNGPGLVLNRVEHTHRTFAADDDEMPEELKDALAKHPVPDIQFGSLPNDPDRLIEGLRNLTDEADAELGRDVIEGREVIGYEIAGEKVGFGPPLTTRANENRAEFWVDAQTRVPVRLVFHFSKQIPAMRGFPRATSFIMTTVYDEFEWDTALPADWFAAVIPSNSVFRDRIAPQALGAPDEAALLKALRQFGELAGRYPASLNVSDVSYEIAVLAGIARAKQLAAKQAGKAEPPSPDLKQMVGLAFFSLLDVTDRKPEYFGKEVKPGQADQVLMRWQLKEGGTRVIYGDLHTETLARP